MANCAPSQNTVCSNHARLIDHGAARVGRISSIPVLAPFPDVAVDIEQSQWVRFELSRTPGPTLGIVQKPSVFR